MTNVWLIKQVVFIEQIVSKDIFSIHNNKKRLCNGTSQAICRMQDSSMVFSQTAVWSSYFSLLCATYQTHTCPSPVSAHILPHWHIQTILMTKNVCLQQELSEGIQGRGVQVAQLRNLTNSLWHPGPSKLLLFHWVYMQNNRAFQNKMSKVI